MSEPITDLETAVRELGALPMPAGTEADQLRAQIVELQEAVARAEREAARAVRERNIIRERVSEPFGCRYCGEPQRHHGRQYLGGVGVHSWEQPTDGQVMDRMLARRAARMPLPAELPERGALWSLLDWSLWGAGMGDVFREPLADAMVAAVPAELVAQAEQIMAEFIERRQIEKTGVTIYQEQRDELERLRARVTELEAERHTTNEALSDAAEALREQRDQLAGLEALDRKLSAVEQGFEALKAQGELLRQNAAEKSADKLAQLLAPREPEGEFHSFLHHRHTTPHDLPPLDGAR